MKTYSLVHLSDASLLRDLAQRAAQERITTADLLAYIAEVDARGLYRPAGYPSMFAYCVEELHFSEDAAYRRIRAARAGRKFPAILRALARGRLNLAAVCLLAPHLTRDNVVLLIRESTHKRKSEIEELLANRSSPTYVGASVNARTATTCISQLVPGRVDTQKPASLGMFDGPIPAGDGNQATESVSGSDKQAGDSFVVLPPQVPVPPSYLLKLTITKDAHDKLRHAQGLLSHSVPNGDLSQVFERALDALIAQLEKRKIGAIRGRPRAQRVGDRSRQTASRYVPAQIRRAVWERDGGRCTFVSANGHRCEARKFLEFDHVQPVAQGGTATVDRIRLRCRAHNQYEAERVFGSVFMKRKREEARLVRAAEVEAKERAADAEAQKRAAEAEEKARTESREQTRDVVAGLRGLGCRADEARRAAEFSGTLQAATLEERMQAALKFLARSRI